MASTSYKVGPAIYVSCGSFGDWMGFLPMCLVLTNVGLFAAKYWSCCCWKPLQGVAIKLCPPFFVHLSDQSGPTLCGVVAACSLASVLVLSRCVIPILELVVVMEGLMVLVSVWLGLLGWARNHVFVVCAAGSAVLAAVGFARVCCFGCFLMIF
ncbi:hypothetical protein U1Q18_017290 [Sarracenia purpurea var. burkii]